MTLAARQFLAGVLCCVLLDACDFQSNDAPLPTAETDALRVVTLSPHLAELVFSVGAGDLLVGVSAYTDYPAAATLPVIGDAFNLDQERLTLLEPDLLLAWDSGTPIHVIDELRNRGFRVEVITTTNLGDIPHALTAIGKLTGRLQTAESAAAEFTMQLGSIAAKYEAASPIRVFYQVDARPLYTINGDHFLSQLIDTCGGVNIFQDLDGLAPLVSVEAVLERNPEVLLASSDAGSSAFDEWDRWSDIAANRYGNRFLMPANEIGRATPRVLTGATAMCDAIETGRKNREDVRSE